MALDGAGSILCGLRGVRRTGCPRRPKGRSFCHDPPEIGEYRQIAGLDAMPVEISEKQDVNREEARRIETLSPGEGVSVEHETAAQMIPLPDRQSTRRRRLLMGVLGAPILVAGL